MTDTAKIRELTPDYLLMMAAVEIREAGHYGWGNTCEQAAQLFVALTDERDTLRAELQAASDRPFFNEWQIALKEADALRERVAELEAALRLIASGDPKNINSPIGPLHAAGIAFQWEVTKKIADAALAPDPEVGT